MERASRPKKPIRMCAVCRKRFPKAELTRYVAGNGEGRDGFRIDHDKTLPGRGIYCCGNAECRERFKNIRGFRKKLLRG